MIEASLTLVAVIGIILALVVLWVLVKKIEKRNTIVDVDELLVNWEDVKCPNCKVAMEKGYAFAGRGIIWVPQSKKLPGTFSNIGQALKNTISMSLRPAVNQAWHCSGCNIIVMDHSKMLRIKKS